MLMGLILWIGEVLLLNSLPFRVSTRCDMVIMKIQKVIGTLYGLGYAPTEYILLSGWLLKNEFLSIIGEVNGKWESPIFACFVGEMTKQSFTFCVIVCMLIRHGSQSYHLILFLIFYLLIAGT